MKRRNFLTAAGAGLAAPALWPTSARATTFGQAFMQRDVQDNIDYLLTSTMVNIGHRPEAIQVGFPLPGSVSPFARLSMDMSRLGLSWNIDESFEEFDLAAFVEELMRDLRPQLGSLSPEQQSGLLGRMNAFQAAMDGPRSTNLAMVAVGAGLGFIVGAAAGMGVGILVTLYIVTGLDGEPNDEKCNCPGNTGSGFYDPASRFPGPGDFEPWLGLAQSAGDAGLATVGNADRQVQASIAAFDGALRMTTTVTGPSGRASSLMLEIMA